SLPATDYLGYASAAPVPGRVLRRRAGDRAPRSRTSSRRRRAPHWPAAARHFSEERSEYQAWHGRQPTGLGLYCTWRLSFRNLKIAKECFCLCVRAQPDHLFIVRILLQQSDNLGPECFAVVPYPAHKLQIKLLWAAFCHIGPVFVSVLEHSLCN